ncbi:MAG: hypothetical protein NC231_12190 [Bacillus sp. (in: Bacteria)]|nr:hypothetical protein [Bacillus sp. (in: firmicutes)]MCM1427123.1 hypothetical protein [Eubacterium sp.]
MLVKIIRGTYGHRPDKNEPRIVKKDKDSPAFELDDKEALRLIALGVAETSASGKMPETEDIESEQMTEKYIMSLEFNDLRKLAKEKGLDSKGTKEELTNRLKAAFLKDDAEEDDAEDVFADDDEVPPELEAQEPV